MIFANAKCEKCSHVFEISKQNTLDDFVLGKCPECKSKKVHRLFEIGTISIAQGALGTSRNNYENSVGAYHPSELTGKVKGTKFKSGKK